MGAAQGERGGCLIVDNEGETAAGLFFLFKGFKSRRWQEVLQEVPALELKYT